MIEDIDSEKSIIYLITMVFVTLALILLTIVAYDSETNYQRCLKTNSQDDCFVLIQ